MEFIKYLKKERLNFAKVASKYTVTDHLELRTAIDDILIAFDQATEKCELHVVNCQREQLVCVDNGNYDLLTVGKTYTLEAETESYYTIDNDSGYAVSMSKVRFEKVKQTNCI